MRTPMLLASLLVAGACGGSPKRAPVAAAATVEQGLQIKLVTIYVDDQDKALRFYTDVLGFAKRDDVDNGGYRWLTVTAPGDDDGAALQLALNSDPAAKAYQQAMFAQSQPATMLYSADVKADVARIKARGAQLAMEPTDISVATIAIVNDTCGNLIQLTQLAR